MIRRHRLSVFAILLTLLLVCAGSAGAKKRPRPPTPPPDDGFRVLFIGSSLTYFNDLPLMVQAFAKAHGQDLYVETVAYGGFDLGRHWNKGKALPTLAQAAWDVVILQQGPSSLPESREHLRKWSAQFDPLIRKAGGRPALYMVWPDATRIEYLDDVRESYSLAAYDVKGMFIPAGEAWREVWRRSPFAPLYSELDDFHPTVAGSYAAALSIYGMLYKREPVNLPARLELANGAVVEVPQNFATLLQEAAAQANRTYGRP